MATGQRPRTDTGNRDFLDPAGEYASTERPGTKKACQGMLLRCIGHIEQGRWHEAESLLSTVNAFIETVTDPQGLRAKVREAEKGK